MCIATCPSESSEPTCKLGAWMAGGDRGSPNYRFAQQTGPLTSLTLGVCKAGGDRGAPGDVYSNVPLRTEARTGSLEDRR